MPWSVDGGGALPSEACRAVEVGFVFEYEYECVDLALLVELRVLLWLCLVPCLATQSCEYLL